MRPLADLVLPLECGGCRRPGTAWCARCARGVQALAFGAGRPHRVVPGHAPEGLPPVHAWGPYEGPLRHAVPAWKDEGRRDLTGVLVPLLARAVVAAVVDAGWDAPPAPLLLVPVPSSRAATRVRGDVPLHDLAGRVPVAVRSDVGSALGSAVGSAVEAGEVPALRCSSAGPVLRVAEAVVPVRAVRDQAHLDRARRRDNLAGALAVPERWGAVVRGRRCVLVDDVLTTGATLAEAARALRAAGAGGVVAAVVAAAPAPSSRRAR